MSEHEQTARVRIDKWLWAARFYKTRSLATQAVDGGKIRLNGERCKPSKNVGVGDQLAIQLGETLWEVEIVALAMQRGSAAIAQRLYSERPESQARRAEAIEEAKARKRWSEPSSALRGRPTKRNRRDIDRFEN